MMTTNPLLVVYLYSDDTAEGQGARCYWGGCCRLRLKNDQMETYSRNLKKHIIHKHIGHYKRTIDALSEEMAVEIHKKVKSARQTSSTTVTNS